MLLQPGLNRQPRPARRRLVGGAQTRHGSLAATVSDPASKLKLRSGEMVLLVEPVADVLAQLRAGEAYVSVVRADGYRNPLHVRAEAIEYVEDVAPAQDST